jgi:type IV fimbrial biogenesis protein FimT
VSIVSVARWRTGRPARGFTAIELMVTVMVMVILMSVAVPGMTRFTAGNRATTLALDFTSSLAVARSEAARAGLPVHLLAVSGGSAGNEFARGWEIHLDTDGDGVLSASEMAATPNPLRVYPGPPSALRLRGVNGAQEIVFGPTGFLVPASKVTVEVCPVDGSSIGVRIEILPNGMADVAKRITCS